MRCPWEWISTIYLPAGAWAFWSEPGALGVRHRPLHQWHSPLRSGWNPPEPVPLPSGHYRYDVEVTIHSTMTGTRADSVAADETDRLIASDKVEGMLVYDRQAGASVRCTISWSTSTRAALRGYVLRRLFGIARSIIPCLGRC